MRGPSPPHPDTAGEAGGTQASEPPADGQREPQRRRGGPVGRSSHCLRRQGGKGDPATWDTDVRHQQAQLCRRRSEPSRQQSAAPTGPSDRTRTALARGTRSVHESTQDKQWRKGHERPLPPPPAPRNADPGKLKRPKSPAPASACPPPPPGRHPGRGPSAGTLSPLLRNSSSSKNPDTANWKGRKERDLGSRQLFCRGEGRRENLPVDSKIHTEVQRKRSGQIYSEGTKCWGPAPRHSR